MRVVVNWNCLCHYFANRMSNSRRMLARDPLIVYIKKITPTEVRKETLSSTSERGITISSSTTEKSSSVNDMDTLSFLFTDFCCSC